MKGLIIIAVIFIFSKANAQQRVTIDSLQFHGGEVITVCGKVADTFVTQSEKKITHLNFEHPYPNQTFSVTIFGSDLPKFKYVPAEFLKSKNVCVTGKVKIYGGKPEMVVNSEEQLKIE